jgi:hypothetical protein
VVCWFGDRSLFIIAFALPHHGPLRFDPAYTHVRLFSSFHLVIAGKPAIDMRPSTESTRLESCVFARNSNDGSG